MIRRFALCLVLILISVPALADDAEDAKAAYKRGNDSFRNHEYKQAIAEFTRAIELNPAYVEAYNMRGCSYDMLSDNDHAIADFSKSIELKPDEPEPYFNRGLCYDNKWNVKAAIADYTKAIEADREYWHAWTHRGKAHLHIAEYDEALSDLNKSIELNSHSAESYNTRGTALLALGDFDRAIADAEKLLTYEPYECHPFIIRGNALAAKGEHERALPDFEHLAAMTHHFSDDAYPQLWVYVARERAHKDGKTALAEFLKTREDEGRLTVFVRLFLGQATPEDCLKAAADTENAHHDSENKTEAYYYIGEFYLLKGDVEAARKAFQSCVDLKIGDSIEYPCARAELKRLGAAKK